MYSKDHYSRSRAKSDIMKKKSAAARNALFATVLILIGLIFLIGKFSGHANEVDYDIDAVVADIPMDKDKDSDVEPPHIPMDKEKEPHPGSVDAPVENERIPQGVPDDADKDSGKNSGAIGDMLAPDEILIKMRISEVMKGAPITLAQDNPEIIKYIWDNSYLIPPSDLPYNLSYPQVKDQSVGQSGWILKHVLNNMRNGFFVECGALDGETRSNTLFMEKELGWKGLLIEGDPSNYELVLQKNRKAWTSRTCLATKPHPHLARYKQEFNVGGIIGDVEEGSSLNSTTKPKEVIVQCVPFYTLLSALNVTEIDYFSLDVEGSEYKVLTTIPFDKVFIKVISVEFVHTPEGADVIRNFVESKGYTTAKGVTFPHFPVQDFIFIHKSLLK